MNSEQRFWNKVNITDAERCWGWTGAKQSNGYGNLRRNKKWLLAHRYSFSLKHGEINNRLMVLHKCDNRLCVNPNHLFLGTAKDNTVDMMNKGRCGGYKNMKLTEEDRKRVRFFYYAEQKTQKVLSEYFNVSAACISKIVNSYTKAVA